MAALDLMSAVLVEEVGRLDPLTLDESLRALPRMNEAADVAALTKVVSEALPSEGDIDRLTPQECLAAMRDLGMYLGSLKRHGVTLFDVIPAATAVFELLGRRTGMIPRDTVFHYTCWNPVGGRERLYTGHPMERSLVDAVRRCMPELARAVETGRALWTEDTHSRAHADGLTALAGQLTAADRAMGDVMRSVAPEFFALELRPYFEDVRIAGRTYMGPAAAHVPLFLVDLLLWASDRGSPEYLGFCREVASLTLPGWRDLYVAWSAAPSLTSRLVAALDEAPPRGTDPLLAGARGLRQALRSLTQFRGKHLVMARRAYHSEVRLYELGSGGGSIGLLEEILGLTRENGALLGAPVKAKDPA
ncbi:monodechloroaminopyrrolnitrin synthase PrnB family protein [Streptomyces sp. NPDC050548]|uniref:monodechloroaminopyrrolnitrin synthase PrnB family protein n=1 Tax=Streptomyces sp. NPDC050548 TaxID=3365629 RepID=UPI0037897D53